MRVPSNAQAALLAFLAGHDEAGRTIEWCASGDYDDYKPGRARLYLEVIDREANTSRFEMADEHRYLHRVATVRACLGHGWLSGLHRRMVTWPVSTLHREKRTWDLRQLDMTEDGVIALGLWRERRLKAPPMALPSLTVREREVVELAQRASELGYALCALEPSRSEARRMRRAGWFSGCWVANGATGLVPTPIAVVEVRPDLADRPTEGKP